MNRQYVYAVLSSITDDGMTNRFEFVWGHTECMHTGFGFVGAEKHLFLKNLKQLWQNGKYSSSNTLLIDIEPDTCLLIPPNTAIFPPPYKKIDSTDTFLGPNGELRAFLEGLADTDHDVPTYVKEHRIGQPAITPSQPDWNSYRMILGHILPSVEEMVSENQDSPTSGAGTSSSVPNLPSADVVADIISRIDGIFDKLTKLDWNQNFCN
ncbi:putative FCP1-like proteiny domain-containing protein [Forsythia ovata]|uniref:FCP1-like proteiny domain-containing protein n=1 Tax=Forsythia ovata TaxID=205694 RepID=A0ABD1T947_9LAMI